MVCVCERERNARGCIWKCVGCAIICWWQNTDINTCPVHAPQRSPETTKETQCATRSMWLCNCRRVHRYRQHGIRIKLKLAGRKWPHQLP